MSNRQRFTDKVVIVGSAQGIGRRGTTSSG